MDAPYRGGTNPDAVAHAELGVLTIFMGGPDDELTMPWLWGYALAETSGQ